MPPWAWAYDAAYLSSLGPEYIANDDRIWADSEKVEI